MRTLTNGTPPAEAVAASPAFVLESSRVIEPAQMPADTDTELDLHGKKFEVSKLIFKAAKRKRAAMDDLEALEEILAQIDARLKHAATIHDMTQRILVQRLELLQKRQSVCAEGSPEWCVHQTDIAPLTAEIERRKLVGAWVDA